ncbi:MAG: hypothetical protein DRJ51_02150 [Thermoprotei archaeon]|nr:MAG: hypothetical protein DRJ51_02150 [Thermoprotei archaeon]RLF03132.1 MAG: hypothetical protein DRJ59_01630 [Thermoprotei archaeon]
MEDIKIIKDPAVAKLLADNTRRRILRILTMGEFSAYELAKMLDKNTAAVEYHLKLLERGGLVKATRTEVKGNLVKRYYTSTAKRFIVSYSLAEAQAPESEEVSKVFERLIEGALKGFEAFGITLRGERRERLKGLIKDFLRIRQTTLEAVLSKKVSPLPQERGIILFLEFLVMTLAYRNPEFRRILEEGSKAVPLEV